MGYTTNFEGKVNFSRPLTVIEYNELCEMNDDPEKCRQYTPKDTLPNAYMQWVSNKDGTALVWDGGEKFYDYIHWLRWLIKYYFTPRDIILNGEFRWAGEEVSDVGVLKVLDNKVSSEKLTVKLTECPECGARFKSDE